MQILFLHNNFPAQFGQIGAFLRDEGWDVWFGTQRKNSALEGVRVFNYEPHRGVSEKTHPYTVNFENAVLNGQALARAALKEKSAGLNPDIVVAHSGWGPGLFAKDLWPDAAYVGYFEWYYRADAPDIEFLGREKGLSDDQLRGRMRNAAILTDLASCDVALCPTQFQASQFPDCFKSKIRVIHDGVDCDTYKPSRESGLKIGELELPPTTEIVTYVARGMEPYRGFPEFMDALAELMKRRPQLHAVVVGEDRVAYGKKLEKGDSYKKRALEKHDFDPERLHFTGLLPRTKYLEVLQASSVHVYLTIPFVLSWSMMEAMSAGCAIVGSNNAPVRELIRSDESGLLVDMRRQSEIVTAIEKLLDDVALRHRIGAAARAEIKTKYDSKEIYAEKRNLFQAAKLALGAK